MQVSRSILFFLILVFFVLKNGWYDPAELVINGKLIGNRATVDVSWDSGGGYNDYEKVSFAINTVPMEGEDYSLVIKNTGLKNPASLTTSVTCLNIIVDGKPVSLSTTHEYDNTGKKLVLDGVNDFFTFQFKANRSIELIFETNNHSGIVEIVVNGQSRQHDLYMANEAAKTKRYSYWLVDSENKFSVHAPLPRYGINELRISNRDNVEPIEVKTVKLVGVSGQELVLVPNADSGEPIGILSFQKVNSKFRSFFDPVQFGFQVLFSLLTLWIILSCRTKIQSVGGVRKLYLGKRKVFWCFFITSFSVYMLWLLVFWPGVMSVDSLKVWRAASLPEVFVNDHPVLNVLFYTYLQQIWNNVAVVPLSQILLISLLSAWIFYRIYTKGVPLPWLVVCHFVLVLSIPVSLYNLVLWKDIPFALLVVYWAFTLAVMFDERKKGPLIRSVSHGLALFLLFVSLAMVRHNGVVYLLVIPCYFLILGFIPKRLILVLSGGVFIIGLFAVVGAFFFPAMDEYGYLLKQGKYFLSVSLQKDLVTQLHQTWDSYWGIWNINQTVSKWDLWHFYLGDRTAYWFLKHSGWYDIYPYLAPKSEVLRGLKEFAMNLYWYSYKVPFVYFSWNPVYMLGGFLASVVLFRRFPYTAIYSSLFLVQVFALLFLVQAMNWRYYYFLYLGAFFLIPLFLWDYYARRRIV